jgi:hypothetical protein
MDLIDGRSYGELMSVSVRVGKCGASASTAELESFGDCRRDLIPTWRVCCELMNCYGTAT